MKSSLLALTAAFALTLGGTAATFSQDSTAPATPEECLVQEGAGATAPGDSLASESGSGTDSASASENPAAEGLEGALGQEVVCPDIENGTGEDDAD